jgi:hypothetical protein
MEKSSYIAANSSSNSKILLRILRMQFAQYTIDSSLTPVPIFSQINLIYDSPSYSFKVLFNINPSSTPRSSKVFFLN